MGRKTYNIDVYALFYMESYHVTHVIITKLNDLRAIRNKLNSFKNVWTRSIYSRIALKII